MTKDLALLSEGSNLNVVNSEEFLDAVKVELDKML